MTTATTTAARVRLRFAKRGNLRLVSHHDLMRCVERMFRRASLPVAESQGFNPRPKAVFTLALALGIEGRREVMDLDLSEPLEPSEVLRRLAAVSPPGLEFYEAEAVPTGRPAQARSVVYEVVVPESRLGGAREALGRFLSAESWPHTRRRPDRADAVVDLRPFLADAAFGDDGTLRFRLTIHPGGSARPEELLDALGLRDLPGEGSVLVRTEMELAP